MGRLARHKWLFFLVQQALILVTSVVFLRVVRALTGKTLHSAKDPFSFLEGAAVFLIWIATSLVTALMYRASEGPAAPPLGLGLSARRLRDLALGTIGALALFSLGRVVGLFSGSLHVSDRLSQHASGAGLLRLVVVGWLFLVGNSVAEEITSRAYPMRLFRRHGLILRAVVPSLFFAVLHLADEPFQVGEFYSRTIAGVALSAAYAFTGNIWLASGIHTGANAALILTRGLWHVGSIYQLEGAVFGDPWLGWLTWTVIALALGLAVRARGWRVPGDQPRGPDDA